MKGSDLRCDCGAGARDVALDMELVLMNSAVSWHCTNGHLMISGSRPGHDGFQQERFPESKVMGVVDELDEETAAVPLSTEGARHMPAAELREREVLAANLARGEVEPEWVSPMGAVSQALERGAAGDAYMANEKAPTLSGLLESMGVKFSMEPAQSIASAVADVLVDNGGIAAIANQPGTLYNFVCPAATRVKRNGFNHTVRCQKELGHEGGHEAKADARTTIWYGEATAQLQTNERYRFGLNPHWMMEKPGRKTMAGDFDNDE